MALELARAYMLIRADTTRLAADIAKGKIQAVNAVKTLSATLNGLMGALGAGTFVAAMVHMVQAGEEFNQKMNQSLAIMGDISDEMRSKMIRTAYDVASATKYSASESAEAYFFLASAGLAAHTSLAALPQMARFAQAGNFDLAKATELATDAQAAMGLAIYETDYESVQQNLKNLTRVTDVLTKANTLADASTEQFSLALTRKSAAAARIVGMELEEVTGMLAAYAMQGTKAYQAGQAVNIVLRDLQTKAIKNKKEFKNLGVAVFDATGNFNHIYDIVGQLEKALEGMSDEQKKASLYQLGFADKSLIYLQTLMGTSKQMEDFTNKLKEAGGMTDQVANKQLTPLQKATARLGSAATETGNKLVEAFTGPIVVALAGLQGSIRTLGAAFDGFHGKALAAAGGVAAFTLSLRLAKAAAVALGVTVNRVLIASGIGAVFVAAGAAVAGIMELVKWLYNSVPVQEMLVKTGQSFADSWLRIKMALDTVGAALSKVIIQFLRVATGINFPLGTVMKDAVAMGIEWLAKLAEKVSTFLVGLTMDWPAAWEFAKTAVGLAGSAITDIFGNIMERVTAVKDVVVSAFGLMGTYVSTTFTVIGSSIATSMSNGIIHITNLGKYFYEMTAGMLAQFKPIMMGIEYGFYSLVSSSIGILGNIQVAMKEVAYAVVSIITEMAMQSAQVLLLVSQNAARLPEALARAAVGDFSVFTNMRTEIEATYAGMGSILERKLGEAGTKVKTATDAINQSMKDALEKSKSEFDRLYDDFGGNEAAAKTNEAIAKAQKEADDALAANAAAHAGVVAVANAELADAWGGLGSSLTELFSGGGGLGDLSAFTGNLFDSLSEQFDAITGRGMFALFGKDSEGGGKKAVEDEIAAMGEPVLPIKLKFVGFADLGRMIQESAFELPAASSDIGDTTDVGPIVDVETEEKRKRAEKHAKAMEEAKARRAETDSRFWDFINGAGVSPMVDTGDRPMAPKSNLGDLLGTPDMEIPPVSSTSSRVSPTDDRIAKFNDQSLKEAEKQTTFQEKILAALTQPLKIAPQPAVLA